MGGWRSGAQSFCFALGAARGDFGCFEGKAGKLAGGGHFGCGKRREGDCRTIGILSLRFGPSVKKLNVVGDSGFA